MRKIILLLILIVNFQTQAQMRYKVKQYMVHPTLYNPGYADPQSEYSINSMYRRQWLRQSNYPETFFLYGHYNIDKTHSVTGLISNDLINRYNQFEIAASYVYNVDLGNDFNLGLGVKAGFNEQNLIKTDLTYFDPVEPLLDGEFTNKHLNFGTGFSLTSKALNIHVSLPYMLGNNFLSPTKNYSLKNNILYTNIGCKFRQNDWFVFYPSTMLYIAGGSKFHASFNLNFLSNQFIWFGAGMDSEYTVNATMGLFLISGFRVIYTVDNKFFPENQTTGFSHEFSVSYAKLMRYNAFSKKKTRPFKQKR